MLVAPLVAKDQDVQVCVLTNSPKRDGKGWLYNCNVLIFL